MNENEIKCKELLEEFENNICNLEGRAFVPSQPNADYSIDITPNGKRKISVSYDGFIATKVGMDIAIKKLCNN